MQDYSEFRRNEVTADKLAEQSIHIGTICTPHFTEHLSNMKHTVNAIINNCTSGFYTDNWSFLNDFGRVDDSDMNAECCTLLDIAASSSSSSSSSHPDDIVYILDENEAATFRNTADVRSAAATVASPPSIIVTQEETLQKRMLHPQFKMKISKSTHFDTQSENYSHHASNTNISGLTIRGPATSAAAPHSSSFTS
jgi:hypothetical protein